MSKTVKTAKRPNQVHVKRPLRYLHVSKTFAFDQQGQVFMHPGETYAPRGPIQQMRTARRKGFITARQQRIGRGSEPTMTEAESFAIDREPSDGSDDARSTRHFQSLEGEGA